VGQGVSEVDLPREKQAVPRRALINPYLLILLGALLNTTGELFLKVGANTEAHLGGWAGAAGLTPLLSGWTWIGIVSYVLSFVTWLHVLRTIPLSVAFPLINVIHVFVPIGASIFLHEHVSLKRWAGISLIILGVLAIMKPVARAEEKL
jgi:undecaprenyl phosphate-alpha-L-ara4N flippase subunit ArnE